MFPFGFTTRDTSRSHATLNAKNSSFVNASHVSSIVTCDENAHPSPFLLFRPLPDPMLNGGSTMQWSMHPSGSFAITERQSPENSLLRPSSSSRAMVADAERARRGLLAVVMCALDRVEGQTSVREYPNAATRPPRYRSVARGSPARNYDVRGVLISETRLQSRRWQPTSLWWIAIGS